MNEFVFIVMMLLVDQVSKFLVKQASATSPINITIIKNFFNIHYATNTGAAFSIFEGMGMLFVVLAVAVSIGLMYYLRTHKVKGLEKWAILFIISGAIGNAIDRTIYGFVVDFLDFYIFGYDYPVFNFADCFICIGAGLFILSVILEGREQKHGTD